jgi:membrane-associated phospholipid phosphatase
MLMGFTVFITNFGDLSVLLPIAAAVLGWFLWSPETRRLGIFWAIALVICSGTIGLLKVYFWACPAGSIISPSGHSGLSLFVYGGLASVIISRAQRFAVPAIAVGFGLVLGIAVTRITSGAHDVAEVLMGLAIGGTALAIFASALKHNRAPLSIKWLLITATMLAIIIHGQRVQAEQLFHLIGGYLHSEGMLYCL